MTITFTFDPAVLNLIKQAIGLLSTISDKETKIMALIQDVITAVAAEKTSLDSLVVFVQGLEAQIKALGLPVATQAQIDAIFASVQANAAEITAAMAATATAAP